jgi:hypothetical protein
LVVERDAAKCGGGGNLGCIKHPWSIVGVGDSDDGRLIVLQLYLARLESLLGDEDLGQTGRRPIDSRDKRWIALAL